KSWRSTDGVGILLLHEACQNGWLSILQLNDLVNNALRNDRFRHTREHNRISLRRNFNLQLERNFTVVMNRRCDVNIDADVQIGELRLYTDVCDSGRYTGVVRSSRYRDLGSNLQRRALPVRCADAWILQNACIGIRQQ